MFKNKYLFILLLSISFSQSSDAKIINKIFFVGNKQIGTNELEYQIELSLEEAISGKEVKMKIPTSINCTDCNGTGAKDGTAFSTCPQCNGAGQVRMSQGFFSVQQPCPRCGEAIERIKLAGRSTHWCSHCQT